MKTTRTMARTKGLALLGLGLGMAVPVGSWAQAQPDPNAPPMAQNPPNRNRRNRGQRGNKGNRGQMGAKAQARMMDRELATAEAVAGKPLTDEQKQKVRDNVKAREDAIRAAREKYVTDLAASLGMEPDAVRLKLREAQANGRGGRRNGGMPGMAPGAAMPPAPGAAAPAPGA